MYLRHLVFLVGGLALTGYFMTTDQKNVIEFMPAEPRLSTPNIIFPVYESDDDIISLFLPGKINAEARYHFQLEASKLILCFFTGWALGRLIMQFKTFILSFFGLFIILLFVLVQSGLIQTMLNFERLLDVVPFLGYCVSKFGPLPFIAFLIGFWVGGRRFQQSRPQAPRPA